MNIPVWRRLGRAILIPVLALLTALAIGAMVMAIFGDDPVRAYQGLFSGAFGNGRAWSTTIRKMTPLIRTGLSVAVDLPTGNVIARIRVPPGPHNVAATGDRWVMVTSPPAGAVTLVDARSLRVVKIFRGFGYPHDVEIDGGRAYVTDEARGQLVVISIAGRRVIARVPVGPRPHDVAVGDLAIVTHGPSQPDLTLVEVSDLDRLRAVRRMAVGGPAHDISKQPDTANIYLTYWGSGVVGAVDGGRGRVLWRRQIGSLVHHVQFDYFHGRRLWVTDHETGRAYLLSSRDGRILRSLGGCPGAHHVAFTPRLAAFACHDSSSLLVYDTATARTRPIRVGAGPHGLAVAVRP